MNVLKWLVGKWLDRGAWRRMELADAEDAAEQEFEQEFIEPILGSHPELTFNDVAADLKRRGIYGPR